MLQPLEVLQWAGPSFIGISSNALQIAKDCAAKTPQPAKLKEFKEYMLAEGSKRGDVKALRSEVEALAERFPMPGN